MNIIRVLILLTSILTLTVSADVTPNPLFSDHAVLQQQAPVPIWGQAAPSEEVTVEFAGQKKVATADTNGSWLVKLDALPANSQPQIITITGNQTSAPVVLRDILVGEVWLCSGQSNMEWALARSDGGPEAVAAASNPLLRMCRVPHNVQFTPQTTVKVKWETCSPATAKNFSAIPYWFGEKLQHELGVAVGIISNPFGGTRIESWLPAETLASGSWPQTKDTNFEMAKADYDRRFEQVRPIQEKFDAEKAAARAAKLPDPPRPKELFSEFKGATTLWNGEIAPLLPLRIRGVAWYQGENNAYVNVASSYKDLLPLLIRDWRTGFDQPDLPFLIFQIARNRKWQTDPNEKSGIAELQEAQAKTVQATPHSALIVTTDMGGPDVHYTGKEPIADRATKAALALAYDRDIPGSSPTYQSVTFRANQAVIHFTHADGGLIARDGDLTGFVIAGKDQKFVFAEAKIDGETVIVSSPQVPEPVAVRYGWADLPKVNLFNQNGFPASTFRTDDWPL